MHGQFGWIYLDWLLPDLGDEEKAHLGRAAARAVKALAAGIDAASRQPEARFSPLSPLGGLGREGYVTRAREALQTRGVAPLAERGIGV